ncbi:MAG: hypothetical protein E6I60_13985 [Chloroflexi bacterium]|nr:MAG: hypothetical protein E6I60_13985 [Chloroflexota bacterium]
MPPKHTAILLLAYGSPNRLEDVEAYFTDIRGGRTPSREAPEELTARYRRVGVPTPLLAVSLELARQLERLLNLDPPNDEIYTVHLGMKHWTPRIVSAINEVVDSGADRLIAIVLAPHFSKISTGGYRRQVEMALAAARAVRDGAGPSAGLDFVESWHEVDGYLQAVAEDVRAVRAEFCTRGRGGGVHGAQPAGPDPRRRRSVRVAAPAHVGAGRAAGGYRAVALLVSESEPHR